MERRTIQTANVIRAIKAYWFTNPQTIGEDAAFAELQRALDAWYNGGNNEHDDAKEATAEH